MDTTKAFTYTLIMAIIYMYVYADDGREGKEEEDHHNLSHIYIRVCMSLSFSLRGLHL